MRRSRFLATLRFMSLRRCILDHGKRWLVLFLVPAALLLVAAAHARPLTTRPDLIVDIHVTITDTRIVLDRHRAPRGVSARFIIKNLGSKSHNFTLSGGKAPIGVLQGFSRTLKPHQRATVRRFLDRRARVPYFDSLPADRGKAGMKGIFVIN
jgi:hypothetical protein